MKIAIIGTGYVGLVTGACLADVGFDVVCVDVDHDKIEQLKKGISPIYEPGLEEILTRTIQREKLKFSTDIVSVLPEVDVLFSAVGTPPGADGSADLQYVLTVAETIGKHMNRYLLVITKSTVPVGTAQLVKKTIQKELDQRGVDVDFDIASNPEFLKEGNAIQDFMRPDRIVVGVENERARSYFEKIYKPFVLNGHPVIFTDIASAEMIKYAANAMLATRISFMNEMANLCELVGADISMVREGIGSDSRIGKKFLYAGIGYGGSCFPKDVKAIIQTADQHGYSLELVKAVEKINDRQKLVLFNKLYRYYDGDLKGKKVAMLGLSFKPNTDDLREAPSLVLIEELLKHGAQVQVYDPIAMPKAKLQLGDRVSYMNSIEETIRDSEALLLVTEWAQFRTLSPNTLTQLMKHPLLLDGRNIYDPEEMKNGGVIYFGIGK
ncbi:MAG TPA: UDP-glucose/GDP-mannose dehydrogenase family protein [Bacteroidales bacterium]|nr:UDP-glucose/GDP-mannose dehydrogenase family protein [Bacteroidales bacterium]HQQ20877.1 UDP-glucose/GDP-mannose dehydrogenase family protein [Bacteroidales bacterium]